MHGKFHYVPEKVFMTKVGLGEVPAELAKVVDCERRWTFKPATTVGEDRHKSHSRQVSLLIFSKNGFSN